MRVQKEFPETTTDTWQRFDRPENKRIEPLLTGWQRLLVGLGDAPGET
jgi:hypothetical protein